MLKNLARGMKDGAIGIALKSFLNERLSGFGEVLDARIDTRGQRVTLRLMLDGETEAIDVAVERYALEVVDGQRFITLEAISCSRPWIATALQKYLQGKRYKLPQAVANFL